MTVDNNAFFVGYFSVDVFSDNDKWHDHGNQQLQNDHSCKSLEDIWTPNDIYHISKFCMRYDKQSYNPYDSSYGKGNDRMQQIDKGTMSPL